MDSNEFQTQVLLHWADTMFKDHKSLQKQVDYNASRTHENELIVGGMVEIEDQSPFQEVTAFIKQKLDIEATQTDIYSAHHIGKTGKIIQV